MRLKLYRPFTVKIAETVSELIEASKLVYDRYLSEGYIKENIFNLWLTHFQLYEDSVVIVGKADGKILSTVSLIFSDNHPLPSSLVFPEIINQYGGKRLCEATCLASIGTADCVLKVLAFALKIVLERKVDFWFVETNPKRIKQFKMLGFEVIAEKDNFLYMDVPVVLLGVEPEKILNRLHPRIKNYVREILED